VSGYGGKAAESGNGHQSGNSGKHQGIEQMADGKWMKWWEQIDMVEMANRWHDI